MTVKRCSWITKPYQTGRIDKSGISPSWKPRSRRYAIYRLMRAARHAILAAQRMMKAMDGHEKHRVA